jgi:hypothetical protein
MPQSSRKLAGFLLGLLVSCSVLAADPVALNPNHPDRYVVVKGDTLWDIAGHFLRDPWYWPEIWHVNPQIANPHLIYPGDVLVLTYVNGKPRLTLERGSTVKLSPQMRSTPLDQAIPAIPMGAIMPFLSRPYVMEEGELDRAPYVVDFADEHIMGGSGNRAYVRAIETNEAVDFNVVRPGKPYRDGDTGEVLGYEALYVGDARLTQTGDPATLDLVRTDIETLVGDRLLPVSKDKPQLNFFPKAPDSDVRGSIIDVVHGVSQIGQYQVVVLDRGSSNGLQPGDILAIDHRGEIVPDHVTANPRDRVKLPDERAGTLMVFRTFPRVSFGLVMTATRAIHLLDRVHNP